MVKWTSLTSFLARKWQQKNQKKRFLPQQQRQLPSHHKKPIAKRTKQKKRQVFGHFCLIKMFYNNLMSANKRNGKEKSSSLQNEILLSQD